MAAEIRVRHCRLHIARRGGWSWGPDPRALLRGALLRLPQLLAARLGENWPEGTDLVVGHPLQLRLAVSRQELAALAAAGAADAPAAQALSTAQVLRRIDAQLQAWASAALPPGAASAAAQAQGPAPPAGLDAASAPDRWGGSVLAVLAGWHGQGGLISQLLAFSVATLSDWHDVLLRAAAPAPAIAGEAPSATAISRVAAEAAALALPLPTSPRATLLRRIACMVQAADELRLACGDARLLAAMALHKSLTLTPDQQTELQPRSPGSADSAGPAGVHGEAHAAPLRPAQAAVIAPNLPTWRHADVEIASALPFLLLGPLSRTGFLRTLGATFEAAGMVALLPAFAVALARKVLAPPQRGWLRGPQSQLAARTFAGLGEEVPDGELAELARLLAPHLGPLDATVADVLARGHANGQPLVLREVSGGGWLLLDADGLFAIAWAERLEQLFARLAPLRGNLLLLPDSSGAAAAMQALEDAGLRFLSDTAPARGQAWRALHAPDQRLASNDRSAGDAALLAAARRLEGLGSAGDGLWQALVAERPGLNAHAGPAVERSLALAAALGLGTLAWTLWHERETVSPLLALERFADLGAHVRWRVDRVEVGLPLGRRFLDLEAAGWLADVADVPWFGGRSLHFGRA